MAELFNTIFFKKNKILLGIFKEVFGFFLVLWEKVAKFGQPSSTGKIGILEDF
jgi:hypothetical protein